MLALVEGQTERGIVKQAIAPYLGERGVYLRAQIIGKPGHKGGVPADFGVVLKELTALAKQWPTRALTTLFDYAGMPRGWPGVERAAGLTHEEIPRCIEGAMRTEVLRNLGDLLRPDRFIPYVQMHEIEALLFAGPEIMQMPSIKRTWRMAFGGLLSSAAAANGSTQVRKPGPRSESQLRIPAIGKGIATSRMPLELCRG
ncbi:MAG: DUF4276 family protein [Verrucomicrobiae bacterium]|nr:DUF4276 family protein [Verrucomicrobiae bacterium]